MWARQARLRSKVLLSPVEAAHCAGKAWCLHALPLRGLRTRPVPPVSLAPLTPRSLLGACTPQHPHARHLPRVSVGARYRRACEPVATRAQVARAHSRAAADVNTAAPRCTATPAAPPPPPHGPPHDPLTHARLSACPVAVPSWATPPRAPDCLSALRAVKQGGHHHEQGTASQDESSCCRACPARPCWRPDSTPTECSTLPRACTWLTNGKGTRAGQGRAGRDAAGANDRTPCVCVSSSMVRSALPRLQKVQNPTGTACAAAPRSLQTLAHARWVTEGRQRPLPSNPGSKLFFLTVGA